MIERYSDRKITRILSTKNKLAKWQTVELAVIKARVKLKEISEKNYLEIRELLEKNSIDVKWFKAKEKEIKHDLAAFVEERRRFLPPELQGFFHQKVTSYDIEDTAFEMLLKESIVIVKKYCLLLENTLVELAKKYRFTIMNGRTHGQEAGLMTFGKRILSWIQDLRLDMKNLERAAENLNYSKLSGIIGNYETLPPELEKETLAIVSFEPYYGATQIMPREAYAPIAQALCQIVLTLDKIATSIRLGARSGRPIFQEPFGKKQKGSSAMPHKKNTISTEQMEGMGRMALGYLIMIMLNIKTWEERAIEQSCVERVAWPDLFQVLIHSLKTMTRVLQGLVVYPDNMLLEIIESRGTYASDEAKELLKKLGEPFGLTVEECYRIVQVAAFNAFEPPEEIEIIRRNLPTSLEQTDALFASFQTLQRETPVSIRDIIAKGELRVSPQLDIKEEDIQRWNRILKEIFRDETACVSWAEIFIPSHLLKNEEFLYKQVFGGSTK
jgi:adenylosuccinate lyase